MLKSSSLKTGTLGQTGAEQSSNISQQTIHCFVFTKDTNSRVPKHNVTQYLYDPGTLPTSANQCILAKVYLEIQSSKKNTM